MAAKNETALEVRGHEAILTRIINAPRELVFEAWTKAEHLSQWFGPHGFTTTAESDGFSAASDKPDGKNRQCSQGGTNEPRSRVSKCVIFHGRVSPTNARKVVSIVAIRD